MALGPIGSLERVIEQVDMEEIGGTGNGGSTGAGRQDHARVGAGAGNNGGRAGGGGAGGASGGGNGAASGWTDMFQGMTVEVSESEKNSLLFYSFQVSCFRGCILFWGDWNFD